jgi:hypothetical protein
MATVIGSCWQIPDGTEKVLLQTYRRDTGEVMHDLSVPIFLKGRHWGGFRMGYKASAWRASHPRSIHCFNAGVAPCARTACGFPRTPRPGRADSRADRAALFAATKFFLSKHNGLRLFAGPRPSGTKPACE